jgi:hypothetical protein
MTFNRADAASRNPDWAVIKFLEDIFATRQVEIQCDQAEDAIAQCAAEGFTDEEARKRYPGLFHHFQFCSDCAAEYEMLMDFAREEAAGLVKRPAYIPPPPIVAPETPLVTEPEEKEPDILNRAADALRAVVEGLNPLRQNPLQPALAMRDRRLSEAPDTIEMEGGEVTITLALKSEPNNPSTRRLICNVETTNDEWEAAFEAAQSWLAQEPTGEPVQEQTLNQFGAATFTEIALGVYTLHLDLADQHFVISDLEIS